MDGTMSGERGWEPLLVRVGNRAAAKIPVEGLSFYAVDTDGVIWSRWRGPWMPVHGFPTTSGHLGVNLQHTDGKIRRYYVQWLVCTAWHGPCPGREYEACHGDGDHRNNRVSNLRWDTQGANNVDRTIHRSIRGE
jgi:hypothetical protein